MKLCACGCGRELIPKTWWKRHGEAFAPDFIAGHHTAFNARRGRATRTYTPRPDEIPSGLCECGCGGRTSIAKYTLRAKRYFIGHPVPRLRGHQTTPKGPAHHLWKGGRLKRIAGYIHVYAPDHPAAQKGYVPEHRLIAEKALGRLLAPNEHVHHINEVKDDNRWPENLVVLTASEHGRMHPERTAKMRAAIGKKKHA